MPFVGILILVAIFMAGNAITDSMYAARGMTPPRIALAQQRAAARAKRTGQKQTRRRSQSPFWRYVQGLWDDAWTDAHTRRQDRVADRREAYRLARERLLDLPPDERVRQHVLSRAARWFGPADGDTPQDAEPEPDRGGLIESVVHDDHRYCLDPGCQRCRPTRWTWACTCGACDKTYPSPEEAEAARIEHMSSVQTNQPTSSEGNSAMTTPTGDITNYETATAEVAAVQSALGSLGDGVAALGQHIASANADVDALDGQRAGLATAVDQLAAALAAKNLDSDTLGHAQAVLDALGPDAVKQMIDALAEIEVLRQRVVAQLDAAVGSVQALSDSMTTKYADAAEVVSSTGVDGSFLNAS